MVEAVAPVAPRRKSVPDEPVTVIVSKNGWVRSRQGHGIDLPAISYKAGDFGFAVIEHDVAADRRRQQRPRLHGQRCPTCRAGAATARRSPPGGVPGRRQARTGRHRHSVYFFANNGSYGFLCSVADATSRQRASNLHEPGEGREVLLPAKVFGDWITTASGTAHPRLPRPDEDQSGGRGVIVMALDEGEALAAVAVLGRRRGARRGRRPRRQGGEHRTQACPARNRCVTAARKGVPLTPKGEARAHALKNSPGSRLAPRSTGGQKPPRFMYKDAAKAECDSGGPARARSIDRPVRGRRLLPGAEPPRLP